jgi:hypothetical protein
MSETTKKAGSKSADRIASQKAYKAKVAAQPKPAYGPNATQTASNREIFVVLLIAALLAGAATAFALLA